MKCKHCGKEIADDSKFCEFCGAKLFDGESNDSENIGPQVITTPISKWMWILIAFILVLGIVITVHVMVDNKKNVVAGQDNIEKLKSEYELAIKNFDFNVENIIIDREGREGAQNWVIGALTSLQQIEQVENDPLFYQSGLNPVFESKYHLYMSKLIEAKANIYNKNQEDLDKGVSNEYYDAIRKRITLINEVTEQIQDGSTQNVHLRLPGMKTDSE